MSVEMRAYDNEHGDPVVVMVTTGTFDVSRLVGLLAQGRCEDHDMSKRIVQAVRRHSGGRAALKLLRDHGGADFTDLRVLALAEGADERRKQPATPDDCPYCEHPLTHHDRPDCWDCTNAGTVCDSEIARSSTRLGDSKPRPTAQEPS